MQPSVNIYFMLTIIDHWILSFFIFDDFYNVQRFMILKYLVPIYFFNQYLFFTYDVLCVAICRIPIRQPNL